MLAELSKLGANVEMKPGETPRRLRQNLGRMLSAGSDRNGPRGARRSDDLQTFCSWGVKIRRGNFAVNLERETNIPTARSAGHAVVMG